MIERGQPELAAESCSERTQCGDIRKHSGPPKTLSDESQGPVGAGMIGKRRGMFPFQDLGNGSESGPPGVRLGMLHVVDQALDSPDKCSSATGGRGGWFLGLLV